MQRINKTIKNQFILMALLALGFTANSVAQEQQETSAFKIPLEYSQGFIVLDDTKNVDHWRIDIENVTLMNASDPDAQTSIVISGLNYFKMPDNYDHLNHSMIINVTGFSESNEMLISDVATIQNNEAIELIGNPNSAVKVPQCEWVCNGNGYAYKIVSYAEDNVSSPHLEMHPATDAQGIPFYQYMNEAQFNFLCSANPAVIGCWNFNNSTLIMKIENPGPNHGYVDFTGNPIVGTIYGIAKNLGPWRDHFITTDVLGGVPGPGCGQVMQWAINAINSASGPNGSQNVIQENGLPLLECLPGFNSGSGSGSNFDMDCFYNINFNLGSDGDIFDYLNLVAGCNGSTYIKWWEDIEVLTVGDVYNGESGHLTFDTRELFLEDGSFNTPNITLDPGLYTLGMVMSIDGYYFPIMKEVKETFNSSIDLSTFFSANIYANPIIDDNFNLEMSVDVTLDIKFVLTDINGVELIGRDFVIKKDQTHLENIRLDENNSLPTGTLIASFIFKDGSTKSYNVIKN